MKFQIDFTLLSFNTYNLQCAIIKNGTGGSFWKSPAIIHALTSQTCGYLNSVNLCFPYLYERFYCLCAIILFLSFALASVTFVIFFSKSTSLWCAGITRGIHSFITQCVVIHSVIKLVDTPLQIDVQNLGHLREVFCAHICDCLVCSVSRHVHNRKFQKWLLDSLCMSARFSTYNNSRST